jgi:hypothetical protein
MGMPEGLRCHYLQDEGTELFGLKLWGTPWQPWFLDWGFNAPRRDGEAFLAAKFDLIRPARTSSWPTGRLTATAIAQSVPTGTSTSDRRR